MFYQNKINQDGWQFPDNGQSVLSSLQDIVYMFAILKGA
jgi:hypothetical protein